MVEVMYSGMTEDTLREDLFNIHAKYRLLHIIKFISLIETSNTTHLSLNKFKYFCKTRFIV